MCMSILGSSSGKFIKCNFIPFDSSQFWEIKIWSFKEKLRKWVFLTIHVIFPHLYFQIIKTQIRVWKEYIYIIFFFLFFFFSPLKWSVINNSYTIWMTTGTCRLYKGKTKKNDTYEDQIIQYFYLLSLGLILALALKIV